MTVQCCSCQKIRSPKGWKNPDEIDFDPEETSHTYCPACYSDLRGELERWKKRRSNRGFSS